jgi:DNA segregation ATPase FtsK/SpoIIIE, S-DNA-T family
VKGSTVSRRVREFVGVALFAAALIWIVALASYEPSDPVWFFSTGIDGPPANFAGRVGAFLAELSFQLVGYGAYLVPVVLVVTGWHYFWCRTVDAAGTKIAGATLLFAGLSTLLSLAFTAADAAGGSFRPGGYAGDGLAGLMSEYFNRTGSLIVTLTLMFFAVIMSTQFSFGRFFSRVFAVSKSGGTRGISAWREWRADREKRKQRQDVIAKHIKRSGAAPEIRTPEAVAATADPTAKPPRKREMEEAVTVASPLPRNPPPVKSPKVLLPEPPLPLTAPEPLTKAPAERRKGDYALPPAALLDAPKTERKIDERVLMDNARLLEEKCREFSVEGNVVQIHPGPVVTTFEFKPDAGVKYSKITGLADDLCLTMRAESVLIDRIPGKSTVGIQIPNEAREQISLRELLDSDVEC